MADAICMGELLVRFVPVATGTNRLTVPAFRKASGGAPANVAVGLAPPGDKSSRMGRAGENGLDLLEARDAPLALVEANPIPSVQEVVP
jgi:fructokinase